MAIKLVIFDMDGTLTEPFLDFDAIRAEIGVTDHSVLILEAMKKMPPEKLKHCQKILRRHEQQAVKNSKLNIGVNETLQKLAKRNIKTAIHTRNTKANAKEVLLRHNLDFEIIHDRNDGPPKPHPSGVRLICERIGVCANETIVVGDFLHDIESANAAGAISVLIKTHADAEKFDQIYDYAIDELTELIEIIDRLN